MAAKKKDTVNYDRWEVPFEGAIKGTGRLTDTQKKASASAQKTQAAKKKKKK